MPLFHIQDNDRPSYVIAGDWQKALEHWQKAVAKENDCEPDDLDPPLGISFIAEDTDVMLVDPRHFIQSQKPPKPKP